ncbi:MAG: RecB-family nuclease [Candidatus Hodarchaeota archaeon]
MNWKNVFFVLHSAESPKVMKEFTRIVIEGFDKDNLVLSRVMGSATKGIEQASKDCFKNQKNLLIIKDLDDLKELINLDRIYLFPPPQYSKGMIDLAEVSGFIKEGKNIAFVFGGGKVSGLTRKELEAGEAVKITERDIGPLGCASILVYELERLIS